MSERTVIPFRIDYYGHPADVLPVVIPDLYRVVGDDFCAGFTVHNGIVLYAAPKLAAFEARDLDKVLDYIRRKGWSVALVPPVRKDREQTCPAESSENVRILRPRRVETRES